MADLITEKMINFNLNVKTRDEAIKALAQSIEDEGRISDIDTFMEDILKREATCTTAIGFGIATPHAKSAGINTPALAFARLEKPIKWDDESEEISMIFMIGVEQSGADQHLEILASIFRQLVHKKFRDQLNAAKAPQDIIDLINKL